MLLSLFFVLQKETTDGINGSDLNVGLWPWLQMTFCSNKVLHFEIVFAMGLRARLKKDLAAVLLIASQSLCFTVYLCLWICLSLYPSVCLCLSHSLSHSLSPNAYREACTHTHTHTHALVRATSIHTCTHIHLFTYQQRPHSPLIITHTQQFFFRKINAAFSRSHDLSWIGPAFPVIRRNLSAQCLQNLWEWRQHASDWSTWRAK